MIRGTLAAAMLVIAAAPLHADLLGVVPALPQTTFNNQGVTTYNAATDMFVVSATPLAVRFTAGSPPRFVSAPAGMATATLNLSANIDGNGAFVGTTRKGCFFEVRGSVDQNGDGMPDFVGLLLSGTVAQFGFENPPPQPTPSAHAMPTNPHSAFAEGEWDEAGAAPFDALLVGVTAQFDFRMTPTGGAMASFFTTSDIGLRLVSERSSFTGSFAVDFSGGAKGSFGVIPKRTGACCLADGSCAATTEAECAALNGIFNGLDTDCDQSNTYTFTGDYTNAVQTAGAGRASVISASFNPITKRLTYEATFKPEGGILPNSYTVAINNGPTPNGLPGQLALFYLDCSGPTLALNAFAYNGRNSHTSFQDGDGIPGNGLDPDKVATSLAGPTFVNELIKRNNPDGSLTLGFDIDATLICAHVPMFPSPTDSWTGVRFDHSLGFWLHSYRLANTDYDAAGCLTAWDIDRVGWLDVSHQPTEFFGCAPPNGACCLRDGSCTAVTEEECAALNGQYNGDNTDCDEINTYTFTKDYTHLTQSAAAGRTTIVSGTFNPSTKRLTWESTFRPEGGVMPNGFTVAINDGPNPNGLPGQLALFYYDCSGTGPIAGPILTVVGYNGLNNPNSYKDGDGIAANDPNPDKILSSLSSPSFVNQLIKRDNGDGSFTLGFDIDATDICNHTPMFPAPGSPWTGAQFDTLIGFWQHPFRLTNTDYDAMGCLTAWESDRQGWVDVSNEHADFHGCVPVRGACCLESGECEALTDSECAAMSGVYAGDGVACSDLDTYIFSKDYRQLSQNAAAGRTTLVYSSYNPTTKHLVWEATFAAEAGVLPNAFTQVINNGPNPNGLPGQLAIFYFDASGTGPTTDPILTVYGYNGQNNFNSYKDGDGVTANDPNPDKILSSLTNATWINSLTKRTNPDGTLTLGFDVNVATINNHIPLFPAPGSPWTGAQFDLHLGFWFHPFRLTDATYDAAGCLTDWKPNKQGWLDVSNQTTRLERCPRTNHLVLHYDFDEQTGETVHDLVGDVDAWIIEDTGKIDWVNGSNGTGVRFDQTSSGRSRIKTAERAHTDQLRARLQETDAVTVQVFFKQKGGHTSGSRIITWSNSTSLTDRNLSIIGQPDSDGDTNYDNWTRLKTTSGTTDGGPDNMWSYDQPTVVAFTYDANTDSTLRIYVNGVLVRSNSEPSGGFDGWTQMHLILGNEYTKDRPFKGSIYDVKIWDGALSPEEIASENLAVRP